MTSGAFQQFVDHFVHRFVPARRGSALVFADSRVAVRKAEFLLINHGEDEVHIPFDGIQLMFAYKRDLITTDLICFDLILTDGDVIEINEEMPGFEQFLDALDGHFDRFDRKWADKVVYPAFVANRTLVYAVDIADDA